jgi:uncharacterized protein YecE (DUF72 family)
MIRVGPAGWSYPDWEGSVYPAHKPHGFHALPYLARFFDTIEINSTFYALPSAKITERWAQLVADHARLRFFAKLTRDFTHLPEPGKGVRGGGQSDGGGIHGGGTDSGPGDDWEAKARAFRAGIDPLVRARRLEGLLVQFPISFLHGKSEVRRLGRLRALFPDVPLVLEVRHQSWFDRPAVDQVRGLSYSLAYIDLPSAWNHPPPWHEPTGPIGYLRLHGRNSQQWFKGDSERDDKYDYLYGAAEMEELAQKARRIASLHDETAVITNNHFSGQAVANAIDLLFLLQGGPVPAPTQIVERYPHLRTRTRIEGQQSLF